MTNQHRDPIEGELRRWFNAEPIERPSSALRDRLLTIPEKAVVRRAWFHSNTVLAAAFTVVLAVIVTAASISFLTDRGFGFAAINPECDDPEGAMQRGLEQLAAADGYRWTEEGRVWDLDLPPDAEDERSAPNGYRAEGAYLAPDRAKIVLDHPDRDWTLSGPFGSVEIVHIGGVTWTRHPAGVSPEQPSIEWQQLPLSLEAMGLTPVRAVGVGTWADAGVEPALTPAQLSWDLPGSGGCVVIRELTYLLPSPEDAEVSPFVLGLRIDAEGRVISGAVERVWDQREPGERRDDDRYRFEVTYELPDASEFSRPEGPIATYPPVPWP